LKISFLCRMLKAFVWSRGIGNKRSCIANISLQQLRRPTAGTYLLHERYLKYEPIQTNRKIEIGHKMVRVIDKKRQKFLADKQEEKKYSNLNLKSSRKLLIAASNPVFNHYTGQVYKNFTDQNLASWGWKNRRSMNSYSCFKLI
jgi:hypothetical protein